MKRVGLVLYPQGGIGNQVVQTAYAYSLALETGNAFSCNPVLMSRVLSGLRKCTYRKACSLLSEYSQSSSKTRAAKGILHLKIGKLTGTVVNDNTSHKEIIERLKNLCGDQKIHCCGYFQRRQAFEGASDTFWKRLAREVEGRYSKRFEDCIGIHVRMGDYLLASSGGIYEICGPTDLVNRGLSWKNELGLRKPLNIFTDSPDLFRVVIGADLLGECKLIDGSSDIEDFSLLSGHRFIIGSNSTFSLCAIRIAHERWSGDSHGIVPDKWYKEVMQNDQMMNELRSSSYWSCE